MRTSNIDHIQVLKGLKSKEGPMLISFPTASLGFFEGRDIITAETTHLYKRGLGAEGKPLRKAVSDKQTSTACHLFFAFFLSVSEAS